MDPRLASRMFHTLVVMGAALGAGCGPSAPNTESTGLGPGSGDSNSGAQPPATTSTSTAPSLQARDLTAWYEEMAVTLERLHGLPVLFKQPPASKGRPGKCFTPRLPEFEGGMADACKVARCIVTWNSNAAVDAVVSGCPAMAFDEGSMAWRVSSHDPAQIITPQREEWAARLAWCQWTAEEVATGAFWPRMLAAAD